MRISDWSSDVCSSDLLAGRLKSLADTRKFRFAGRPSGAEVFLRSLAVVGILRNERQEVDLGSLQPRLECTNTQPERNATVCPALSLKLTKYRSEEHTSEIPSLMRTSYAVFCLQKIT